MMSTEHSNSGGRRVRILQVFNRYLEYGGEEGSVGRIAETLQGDFDLTTYYGSTESVLEGRFGKLRMPFLMRRNRGVIDDLRELQARGGFDVWQVHNVFPAISVAVYELAEELGVPVVQYLHNYRFGCPRATLFVEGTPCTRCIGKYSYGPALARRCWRDSLPATAALAFCLNRFHRLGMSGAIRCYIAISECQKEMHVRMGFPRDRIRVLPHFLEAGADHSSSPPEEGDVLFLGRITEEKGVELLLRAWSGVQNHGRRLRIVGDGPMLPEMRGLAAELRLENVVFEGFVPREEHSVLWREASFFVAPSVWMEPFGMVLLEAWRQGRPVLATNLGSFPEMVDDGKDGWLADPSPEGFAEGLQRALDSKGELPSMGRAGREKLEQRFNRDRWLEGIRGIYDEMNLLPR